MATKKKLDEDDDLQPDRFIVLLRHGIAEDHTPDKPDEERGQTSEGHARMKQIARGLESAFPKAQAIYASPLLRAVQTALWVSKGYRSRLKVNTTDALVPGAGTKELRDLLASTDDRRIILVGHEPNLTSNAMELIGLGGQRPVELKKGGAYGIRLRADGTGVLEWLLSPRILRKMAESD